MMNETMKYIFRKIDYLEHETKRIASSRLLTTVTIVTVGTWVVYFKNRKIDNLKTRVKELEEQLKKANNAKKE